MLTITYAETVLQKTIQGELKHRDYDRTIKVAEWAKKIITGKNQDDLITQFKSRESKEQKKQRVELYSALTPLAAGQILSVFRKVRRTDGIYRVADAGQGDKGKRFEKAIRKFYGRNTLDEYLFDIKERLTFYDPNAFLLVDFKVTDISNTGAVTGIQSYPVEISSAEAINYEYWNGELQWLIVERKRMGMKKVQVSDFYCYIAGATIHYHEPDPNDEKTSCRKGTKKYR
jgi:hypothetical protein